MCNSNNIPLVVGHGPVGVVKVEVVGKVVLSAHGLGEAVGDVDLLAVLSHGRHCCRCVVEVVIEVK